MSGGIGLSPRQQIAQSLVDRFAKHGVVTCYERALIKGSRKGKRYYRIQFDTRRWSGSVGVMGERHITFNAYSHTDTIVIDDFVVSDLLNSLMAVDDLCG